MISLIRRLLETWPAKLFFLLLAGVFVIWGVGDVITRIGGDQPVARVAGQRIELPQADQAYRRQLDRVTRMLGNPEGPSVAMRKQIANEALQGLITRIAITTAIRADGIRVPDAALRKAAFAMPAFHGKDGRFDKNLFQSVLQQNNYSEQQFLDLLRIDLLRNQFMGGATAGVMSPDLLSKEIYAFQHEKRVAATIAFPFAAAPAPKAPGEAEIKRWYENHKDQYSTPELRRIKAIVLSPETVAKNITVTDAEIKAAYERGISEFRTPQKRSIEVVLLDDEAKAKALAAAWRAGADWAAVEALAKKDGGTPVSLKDATKDQIPTPELAQAVFAAPVGTVPPPVHSALGWHVLKVTGVTPASHKTLAEVRKQLKARVLASKAADIIYDRANKIDDMLSAGTPLDKLPADLGVAAVEGTLDAEGNKLDGKPAPIPGDAQLRAALVAAVFKAKPGEPAHLIEGPRVANAAQSFFAFSIEKVIPPAPKPLASVHDEVVADWTAAQRRREQNVAATNAMEAIKAGQSIAAAAAIAGQPVKPLPPTDRSGSAPGVPHTLVGPLFTLKKGEATMVETPDGFLVAVLTKIDKADPASDPVGFQQVQDTLARSIATDIESAITLSLRDRGNPEINQAMASRLVQTQ